MKAKKLLTIFAFAIIAFAGLFTGCAKDDFEPIEFVCPLVISTDPVNGATSVPLNKIISATFNVAMDARTITSTSFIVNRGTTVVAGTISYAGTTATFTPASPLAANTVYTVRVTTSVKDLHGNALQKDHVWSFTTSTIPTVTATDPVNLATGVLLNKVITATFSEPMIGTTITAPLTFTLRHGTTTVAGTVTYSGLLLTFTPSSNLLPGTTYTATITTAARNLAGTSIASNFVWTFTTSTIPTIISTDPLNLATGVPLNKIISATFSETMNAATITAATTFTLRHGTTTIAGTVSYSGVTAVFTPSANLLAGTTYTATITTAARNLAGNALANNHVWTFTTVAPAIPVPVGVDLRTAARFGILAGTAVSNNAGFSEIRNMDVGISPGARSSITGFPPAIVVNGAIFAADDIAPPGVPAMLLQAKTDLTNAYLFLEAATAPAPAIVAGDLGGLTLAPGIYKSTSTLLIQSGNLTLDAQGDVNAVWIFQIASDFTTVGNSGPFPATTGGNVILAGGAKAKNVFWQVGSSATIGDYTSFKGNILALTSITMNSFAVAEGRMLARNGAVTMTSTNIINRPLD